MLNKRQEQILAVLSEKNQWITGKSLSAMMKVSDRTIRSDIETINREIEASPIESNVRLGYRIAGAYQGKTADPENDRALWGFKAGEKQGVHFSSGQRNQQKAVLPGASGGRGSGKFPEFKQNGSSV